ncbi:hypothetical protein M8C21_030231 [Ambrosia artemisiifolia]|uniref:Uncharacterized protein n=1 Tax=Ambrosia artemisiifolia TaxID=4212 RepID=A0AAD5GNF4_AMBAR|nr:hypothetical protein M8C21_030231 [Ambrosia artemisiifolia]
MVEKNSIFFSILAIVNNDSGMVVVLKTRQRSSPSSMSSIYLRILQLCWIEWYKFLEAWKVNDEADGGGGGESR